VPLVGPGLRGNPQRDGLVEPGSARPGPGGAAGRPEPARRRRPDHRLGLGLGLGLGPGAGLRFGFVVGRQQCEFLQEEFALAVDVADRDQ
jgi:hypothetical protein